MIMRFDRYHLLLDGNSTFMTDSLYLGTIQISRNWNEHCYYLTSTKSVIWQIDASFSPHQSLNMLPFHSSLERLKLICYGLISIFSKYYFKIGTICLPLFSSHVFTTLEFDSNHLNILLWKIVNQRDHNETKPPIKKIFRNYKSIRHYFVMSQK